MDELLESWLPPERARAEWERLLRALLALRRGPVCVREPELWQSRRPVDVEAAVAACISCPAGEACRAYALVADEPAGTWGGTTELERRALAGRSR